MSRSPLSPEPKRASETTAGAAARTSHPSEKLRLPIIGIATSVEKTSSGEAEQVGLAYVRALEDAGGCPILLPVAEDPELAHRMLQIVDGVVLPGGGDISPRLYGEKPEVAIGVDEREDRFQLTLCRGCVDQRIPLLAICRGLQVLNVALGGTLIQDIATEVHSPVNHHQTGPRDHCTHDVLIESSSRLAAIIGQTELSVNSFHHQAVDRPGSGLRIAARAAEDGVIEGLEAPDHPFLIGVQFHPEAICHAEKAAAELFRTLIEAAAQRKR